MSQSEKQSSVPSDTRELRQRARRTRWIAEMTVDPATRDRLMGYARELERDADDASAGRDVPPHAPHRDRADIR